MNSSIRVAPYFLAVVYSVFVVETAEAAMHLSGWYGVVVPVAVVFVEIVAAWYALDRLPTKVEQSSIFPR